MEVMRYRVKLDMEDSGTLKTQLRLKQGDSAITLVFKIMKNGIDVYSASDVPTVVFKRSDGTSVVGNMSVAEGQYTYTMAGNELQIAGPMTADVKFDVNTARESTCTFGFECVPDTMSPDTNPAGIFVNSLKDIINAVQQGVEKVEQAAATLDMQEIIDIKNEIQALVDRLPDFTIDSEMSDTSEHALQNKVITNAINRIDNKIVQYGHNIPRLVPKDITSYYTDGTLWKRLKGTDGFSLYEDIFVGDYFKMSRPISAYERTGTYQTTGSQYVTIAGISTLKGNGDNISMLYEHLVMVPGQGFGGTQHFGQSRMNPTNTTVGGYAGSEMFTTTLGEVATSGSTERTASINQQLYAEFGSHLQTTRELLSKSINESGYNRFGTNSGCSNGWSWYSCQAVLMSEIELYGSTVWSSSGFDTGTANTRLPLFAHSTQALNNRTAYPWLKDVSSSRYFCHSGDYGNANSNDANNAFRYVRPRFVLS